MNSSRRIYFCLQARTSSERLFAKSLLPFGSNILAELCYRRCAWNNNFFDGSNLFVLTSNDDSDNILCNELAQRITGIKIVRGDLTNVADRFLSFGNQFGLSNSDIVVRLTADNPCVDGPLLTSAVSIFIEKNFDYLSSNNDFDTSLGYPVGLSFEIFRYGYYTKLLDLSSPLSREHVTTDMRILETDTYASLTQDDWKLKSDSKHAVTIDHFEDYQRVYDLFDKNNLIQESCWHIVGRGRG